MRPPELNQKGPRNSAAQPAVEKGGEWLIGGANGGMTAKRHAVIDAVKCPIRFFVTAGQASDDAGVNGQHAIG